VNEVTVPKPQISTGGALAALVPQNLEETYRLSQALAKAGDMVPKNFQQKPEEIMAAIMRGMEIGLAPMQALSNIAVINGRATVWGDALPAMMQRAGHHIDVSVEGEGDAMCATATLTRADGRVVVRQFTVADAKKANLWGKAGPWQTYPKRMLSHRARGWAIRDGAADALMGLQIAEEMQDAPPIKDVTPRNDGFAALAKQARAPEADIVLSGEDQRPATEPEDVSQDDGHWTDAISTEDGAPGSPEFDAGAQAYADGEDRTTCPHNDNAGKAADWLAAWDLAERSDQ
jgi:hypothetical protein